MRRIAISTFIPLVLLGLIACGGDAKEGGGEGGPPGGMQLPVEAMTVQPEALGRGVVTVGTLRADEAVTVRPEVAGRIVKIHFNEGDRVKARAPLFTLDDSVARASLREAQANLANARQNSTRSVELARGNLISRAELDNAQAQLAVGEARVASARAQLDKMRLVAPFAGVTGLREVSEGAYVNIGQNLVNLVALDPMEVDFSLPESQLVSAKVGQSVTITVDAFAGETFTGELKAIEPVIDINSRNAKLRAHVPNADYKLRPGLFARVNLGTGSDEKALLVPEEALLQQGETRYVYRIVDGKATRAVVKTGQRLPGRLQIIEGLKPGDQVITAGHGKPFPIDGMPVAVVPSGGAAAPGAPAAAKPAEGQPGQAKPAEAGKPAAAAESAGTSQSGETRKN